MLTFAPEMRKTRYYKVAKHRFCVSGEDEIFTLMGNYEPFAVHPDMECGWERIYRRLAMVGRLDVLNCPVQIRDYSTDKETAKKPETEGN